MLQENMNVHAKIQPNIKVSAEAILQEMNFPVSALIDLTYRQVIRQHGIPFELVDHRDIPTLDSISDETLEAMIRTGLEEAKRDEGLSVDKAFEAIRAEL